MQTGLTPAQRRVAYAADVTYVTNSELGFDYLRDNLAQVRAVSRSRCWADVGVESPTASWASTTCATTGRRWVHTCAGWVGLGRAQVLWE